MNKTERFFLGVLQKLRIVGEGAAFEMRVLPLSEVRRYPRYQRKLNLSKVDRIADRFNPLAAGFLMVSQRATGAPVLFDGNHRLHAMKQKGFESWPCLVVTGLKEQEEAQLWMFFNTNRSTPKTYERLKARVVSKDPEAVDLARKLQRYGINLPGEKDKEGPTIRCVAVLEEAQRRDRADDLLDIVSSCWCRGDRPTDYAYNGEVLRGLLLFLSDKDIQEQVDYDRVVKVLSDPVQGLPTAIYGRARARWRGGKELCRFIADEVVELYNRKLKAGRRLEKSFTIGRRSGNGS